MNLACTREHVWGGIGVSHNFNVICELIMCEGEDDSNGTTHEWENY